LAPPTLPRLDTVSLDYRVFAFALGASLLTVLLFGLVPALHATRTNLAESLKSGLRAAGGTERARLRKLLVTAEIALSLVLLVGAGLMIRSFLLLQQVRPGFNPESLLTFQIALPFSKYGTPQEVSQFFRQLTENVEALPGVEAVGGSFPLPMSGRFWTNDYAYDEETEQNWGGLESDNHVVLPGYFRSLGARVLAGRTFTWADEAENAKVIVIDDKLARKAWPGENPIGKRLTVLFPNNAHEPLEVIGVVAHIRQSHPGADGREQTYLLPAHWPLWGLPLTVRASLPPGEALRGVKREVRALDPELAVFQVRTMRGYVSEVTAGNRFAMFLMGLFAVLAAALAAIGLYGTIAYSVAQRSHEIGIRMALGASPRQVFRLVVGQGVRLTAVGIVLGVAASFLLTRFLSSLLYGVNPMDWPTYAGITVLLVLIALLACYLPARRATRVQPMVALRYE
ncbi:MAG: FtsX-like permease family protein, partial [Terriglobia bacterium]